MIEPALSDDAFLADVEACRDRPSFHLWWLGQSGFLLHYGREHLLIDPYLSDSLTTKYAKTDKPHVRMTRRVIDPARLDFVDAVTASHLHTDHLDPDTLRPIMVAARRQGREVRLVAPESCVELAAERAGIDPARVIGMNDDTTTLIGAFEISAVTAAHERVEYDERGCKYLGYLVRFGDWTIYHSGDTVLFDGMVPMLSLHPIDLALLPINGRSPERRVAGNLNGREAARLAKDIGAKLVIPCHYDMFEFNTADPRDQFIPECERLGQPYQVLRAGERWSMP